MWPNASFCLPDKPAKIISLSPATTEILFALGLGENIIGVSSFCNYPKDALSKEHVGTFSQANIEKIISLKPDIIFCTGLEQSPIIEELKQLKLNVFVSDPSNFNELFSSILEIGKLTDTEGAASKLVEDMRNTMNEIAARSASIPFDKKLKVFIEIWHDPLMSAGRGSFLDEMISIAGGINIASSLNRPYSFFSAETVLKSDPDVIILAYMTKDNPGILLGSRMGWDKISAVKNKRVYNDINPDILLRPGPRLISGLKEIHKKLYQ